MPSPNCLPDMRAASPSTGYFTRELGEAPDSDFCRAWQSYIESRTKSTIYHDLAWRDIFAASLGYRCHLLMVEDAGGSVRGLLPLYRVPSLLGKPRLVAVPFRDRGGILADNDDAFLALVTAARDVMVREGAESVVIKTIEPYDDTAALAAGLVRRDHWQYSRVDLAGLTEPALMKALGQKTRNFVRQGMRAELTFADCTKDSDAVGIWYRIYQASQQSLGVPPFPRSFFERMFAKFVPRDALNLFVVSMPSGEQASAVIILHDSQSSIYAYAASRPHDRRQRPNDFMLYQLFLWHIERGRTRFDFGADSPHQDGLLWFKRKWLATQSPIPYYFIGQGDPQATDSSAERFRLARRVVRATPQVVARNLLSPLVRYFG